MNCGCVCICVVSMDRIVFDEWLVYGTFWLQSFLSHTVPVSLSRITVARQFELIMASNWNWPANAIIQHVHLCSGIAGTFTFYGAWSVNLIESSWLQSLSIHWFSSLSQIPEIYSENDGFLLISTASWMFLGGRGRSSCVGGCIYCMCIFMLNTIDSNIKSILRLRDIFQLLKITMSQ